MNGNSGDNFVIETTGLTKLYGKLRAVDAVSIGVKKGEIYGFLGLNGAGKTTTIRMLLGMIHPASGVVAVLGERIRPGSKGPWEKVGYLVETPNAYPELTVQENLLTVSRLRGMKGRERIDGIVDALKLGAYRNVKARNLSLGNKQRLGLAKALFHEPEILILDEPSNGLDPAGIVEIRELLRDMAARRGVTIFVSSHNLDEVSRIATRIGIIHRGKLIRELDSASLNMALKRTLVVEAPEGAAALLAEKGPLFSRDNVGRLRCDDAAVCDRPEEIAQLLVRSGYSPRHLAVEAEDLESYFLRIIGGEPC